MHVSSKYEENLPNGLVGVREHTHTYTDRGVTKNNIINESHACVLCNMKLDNLHTLS